MTQDNTPDAAVVDRDGGAVAELLSERTSHPDAVSDVVSEPRSDTAQRDDPPMDRVSEQPNPPEQECVPGARERCYTGPSGQIGVGECRSGTRVCGSAGRWSTCQGLVLAKKEVCDKKDNDCDGQVDEGLKCSCHLGDTRACGQTNKGLCRRGSQKCSSAGLWEACVGEIKPTVEKCDKQDNDCDGTNDEICGPGHPYVLVMSAGTIKGQRRINSVTRLGKGRYGINAVASCKNKPAFASVYDERKLQVAGISCGTGAKSSEYIVDIVERDAMGTPQYADSSFYLIIPSHANGEIFGKVDGTKCKGAGGTCIVSHDNGTAQVRRIAVGVFEITATACASATQPIFGSTAALPTQRALVAENKGGKCYIRLFDQAGKAVDDTFSFWLPDVKTNAFVRFNDKGMITAKNDFGDQLARWTVRPVTVGSVTRYDVSFPAWINPSAVIHTPNRLTPKQLGVQPRTTLVELYPFDLTGPLPPRGTTGMSVLFVQ